MDCIDNSCYLLYRGRGCHCNGLLSVYKQTPYELPTIISTLATTLKNKRKRMFQTLLILCVCRKSLFQAKKWKKRIVKIRP